MISAGAPLSGSYDPLLVALSALIAVSASYAALDLAGRVTAASGWARSVWQAGGAVAMGMGIWAMHFVAMRAFSLSVPVSYDLPTVVVSLLAGIVSSAFALYVVSRNKLGPSGVLVGSVIMGAGIAAVHYIGMSAMRLAAVRRYEPWLVTLSVALAILFSLFALVLAFDLREQCALSRKIGSAIVMGTAISAMHYTAMAAAIFTPSTTTPDLHHAVSVSLLGSTGIGIVTLFVLAVAILTSAAARRLTAQARELEQRVNERTRELSAANEELRRQITERERAEEDVRRSEDRLRLVIDQIPQQIWSGPPDGSLDFANAQWRFYMGLTQEELRGDGWQSMLHPEDRERVLKAWSESVVHGTPYEQEERHRRADGQYRWFLSRGVPLRDSDGRIVRWYGTNTDIEDRKGAEDRLRLVIDTLPAMVWSKLPDGSADFLNQRFREYTGLSVEEGLGWGWMKAFHPEDRAAEQWRAAFAAGQPFEKEARLMRADGAYRWFLLRAVPFRAAPGEVVKWYGTTTDIEDRRRAEDELRKQKEVFQKIFEHLPVMIGFVAADDHIELVNPEWERTMGWTLKEIREQNLDIFAEGYPDPEYRQMVLDFVAASTGEWADLKVRVRDGRVMDLAVAVVRLSDGTSVFIGRDITERKRAEEALQEAQAKLAQVTRTQAMGELAAAIAHEVNQPLTAIVTNANFSLRQLRGATPNLDDLRTAITEIVNDGTRASAVISRIRGLLVKGTPRRAQLDINEIIQKALTLMRNELSRNRVHVRTELVTNLPRVQGDPVQLEQVLINLIMNALEAMRVSLEQPRKLLIRSAKNALGVLVQVQDSGPGIEPGVVGRIFEPFFSTKAEGIGMGLSISHSIIESHGGRLRTVPSSTGAMFEFTLPADGAGAS